MFDLESVAPCVLAAKPDMSQAILCYGPMIETCAGRDGREAHLACQRRAEGEWAALAERYGDQPMTRRLASAFDPAACERLSSPGLPLDEGRLQCRITALLSRALYGHIESLWGGLGPGLRP